MPFVFAAIAPHGGDILEELADDATLMATTRASMIELGRRFSEAAPETVIVLDPHALHQVAEAFCIGATFKSAGVLGDLEEKHIQAIFDNDAHFVEALFSANQNKLPLVRAVGEEDGRKAMLPLSWGALIPLWFTAQAMPEPRPKTVIVALSRLLPREDLVRFGVLLARVAAASPRRIALIASCDLGHAHDEDGPYGFSRASAEHDLNFCDAIVRNDLGSLLDWDEAFLEDAKVDAFWQALILAGALGHTPMKAELLSYEAPTYFGMAVASFSSFAASEPPQRP
jgi:aromatic ring-opening dioxygenase LigB subunit